MCEHKQRNGRPAGSGKVCRRCAPHLELRDREGRHLMGCAEALMQAGFALLRGEIVGVQGLGRRHYLADARHDGALSRLRLKAGLPEEVLPLMYASIEAIRVDFHVSEFEEKLLQARDVAPVSLARKRSANETPLAGVLAGPSPTWFRVLLPRTRLQALLLAQFRAPVAALAVEDLAPVVARAARGLRGMQKIADFLLILECPAWLPEAEGTEPAARCGLGTIPERGGPVLARPSGKR
jgi:hydrogenase maturation factor HypF (carbamoyltransferase family)